MFTVVNRGEPAAVVPAAKPKQGGREAIHSGHFMVSQFEAEEQDDEYELAVPIPEVTEIKEEFTAGPISREHQVVSKQPIMLHQPVAIDTSLAKLFQCMSIAYRQKLTSPKWNRFRGIRLRWKDKIRLNNVIWRCWHMQFIKKINTLICQFASPLDVDTHNKPEAIVLEGKYWKRKLAAVTAEYKKWRMYYRNNALGHSKDPMDTLSDLDSFNWNSQSSDGMHMMVDEDYLGLMSDTLFSTITNQPFVFPDSREIAKAGLADFIQPSLGPLQPNLDDYMDTFEPLQEFITGKLPTVPEENNGSDALFKQQQEVWCYTDLDLLTANQNIQMQSQILSQYEPIHSHSIAAIQNTRQSQEHQTQQIGGYGDHAMMLQNMGVGVFVPQPPPPPPPAYQPPPPPPPPLLGKRSIKQKNISAPNVKPGREVYIKASPENLYSYTTTTASDLSSLDNRLQAPKHQEMHDNPASSSRTPGYKFATIAPAVTPPNLKFTSQPSTSTYKMLPHRTPPAISPQTSISMLQVNNAIETKLQKESNKTEGRIRNVHRGIRQRSISTSREPVVNKRPPLLTAISDPSLVTPSSSVLTQLLTNNSPSSMFMPAASSSEQKLNVARVKEENSSTSMPLLPQPQPPPTSIIVATPVGLTSSSASSLNDPLFVASIRASNSSSPASSQQSMGSCPTSPQGSSGLGGPPTRESHSRRSGHLHAEQKRRYNIKNGFDMIQSLIPHLQQNPNAKLSKAAMLQKGAEYIRQLRIERSQLKEEMDSLRQQIDSLNTSISNDQSLLPATGAPVSRRRNSKMQEMFDEYVKKRTMEDWKFWIFSLLFRPLLSSFNNFVSTSSIDDLYRSTLLWVEQHCTLVDLRPMILNSLRYLCTKTDILSEPEKLPDEARQAVLSPPGGGGGGGNRRPALQQL